MTTTTEVTGNDSHWYEEHIKESLNEYSATVKVEPHSLVFNDTLQPLLQQENGLCLLTGMDAELRATVIDSFLESPALVGNVVFITDGAALGVHGVKEVPFPVLSGENPLDDFDAFVETVTDYAPKIVIIEDVSTPEKAFIAAGLSHENITPDSKISVLAEIEAVSPLEGVHKMFSLTEASSIYDLYDERFMNECGASCGGDWHIVDITLTSHIHVDREPNVDPETISLTVAFPWDK